MKLEPMKTCPTSYQDLHRVAFPAQDAFSCAFYSRHFIGTGFRNQIVGAQKRLKGSGVGPPPVKNFVAQISFFNIGIVNIGNFELASAGGFQAANFLEYRGIVEIDPRSTA